MTGIFPAGCPSRVQGAVGRGYPPWDTQGVLDTPLHNPGLRGHRTPQPALSPRNAQSQPLQLHLPWDHSSTHWDLGFPALQLCSPPSLCTQVPLQEQGHWEGAPDVTVDGDTPNTTGFSHPKEPVLPTCSQDRRAMIQGSSRIAQRDEV